MNWRHVHKEKVDKQNLALLIGQLIKHYIIKFEERIRVLFPYQTSLSLSLSHTLGLCKIHHQTKYYDVAMVWCLGYASIRDRT